MEAQAHLVGPYRIEGLLGRGGGGTVHRAVHLESGATVALKSVQMPSAELLPALRREVAALGRLRHPGIVRILDSGTEAGVPWIAMELITGPNLRQYKEAHGHASLQPMLIVVRRLCDALSYLHGEGLVHRDLKPENILVRDGGQPVLVDFGVAAPYSGTLSREILDLEAEPSGTLPYMAPEQLRGELFDARADLYALGCILYELLSGRTPFHGRSAAGLVQAHLHEAPEPLSGPSLPEGLERLVLKLLAKSPRERLGHADDLAVALAALGAGDGHAGPKTQAYLYRPELSGRKDLLERLEARLVELEAGTGGLLLLGGESGVGKTRLLLELGLRAGRRGVRLLAGECVPAALSEHGTAEGGARPLQPLCRPLQAIANRCRSWGAEETDRLLGRRGKLLALYEPALSGLPGQEAYPPPADVPTDAALKRLYTVVAETFAALAEDGPILLVLDDLQWADELTLGFLEHWLRATTLRTRQAAPLLVVGTYRTEEVAARQASPLQRLIDAQGLERIVLGRLEEAAVGSIVGDMLALSPPPPGFVRFLARHSEGNPFFVAEYLRVAIAEGVLMRAEGRWQAATEGHEPAAEDLYERLPLPRSLRETVQRRLGALSDAARRLAEAASVLGRELDEALLDAISRSPEVSGSVAASELVSCQILEEPRAGRLRFVHDKIREVAYGLIDAERKRALHRDAAEAIEARGQGEPRQDLAALGHHMERAGSLAKARGYYLAAAREAGSRHALAEAGRLYQAHLALVQAPTAETVAALNELGRDVLHVQGQRDRAVERLKLAQKIALELQDRALQAISLRNLAIVEAETGNPALGQELLEQALALQRSLGDRAAEANLLVNLSFCLHLLGQFEAQAKVLNDALRLARETDQGTERILEHLGILCGVRGEVEEAHDLLQQAATASRVSGNRRIEASVLVNLANILDMQQKKSEAIELYQQAIAIDREVGDRFHEAFVSMNLGDLYAEQGLADRALAMFEQAVEVFRQTGHLAQLALSQTWRAILERRLGRLESARAHLEEAGAGFEAMAAVHRVDYLCEMGQLALATGEPARKWLDSALELAGRLSLGPESSAWSHHLSRLQRALEAFEAGRPLFRGECWEELPEGLRRCLGEAGQ